MNKAKSTVKISNRAINDLMFANINAFHLYVYLRKISKNETVGVNKEVTRYRISKEMNINKTTIKRLLEKLAILGFIKIYQDSPLIIQFIDVYPDIEPLQGSFKN